MSTDNLNGTLSSTGNLNGTFGTSGGGGTSNYNDLTNKPQINGNTLEGNKTPEQLGINIPDMTNYYNKSETNTLLDGKANVSDLPDMNNYYDKSETDNLLDGKANVSDLPDMNNYYNKSETDNLLDGKANVSDLPDMNNYYNKSETDNLLDGKVNNSDFNAASLPITSGSATNTKDYIDSGLSGKEDSITYESDDYNVATYGGVIRCKKWGRVVNIQGYGLGTVTNMSTVQAYTMATIASKYRPITQQHIIGSMNAGSYATGSAQGYRINTDGTVVTYVYNGTKIENGYFNVTYII